MPKDTEMTGMDLTSGPRSTQHEMRNRTYASIARALSMSKGKKRGYMGPPGSMPKQMVMAQGEAGPGKMMTQNEAFMEGQRRKAAEKEAGRKARLANRPKDDDATAYYKKQANEQRQRRGMQ